MKIGNIMCITLCIYDSQVTVCIYGGRGVVIGV